MGLVDGESNVQLLPLQVHVSETSVLAPVRPPKRTIWPLRPSKAREAPERAVGLVVGLSCSQVEPVQDQVSLM